MSEQIDLDSLDNLDFETLDNKDQQKEHLDKMKGRPVLKGTGLEKSFKKQLAWNEEEKTELEKYQKILGEKTLAKTIYKLIDLGKQKIREDLLSK